MLCAVITRTGSSQKWTIFRVVTSGQWAHGRCVFDRGKRRADRVNEKEVVNDVHGWLGTVRGNRIGRMIGSPRPEAYHAMLAAQSFGP